MRDLRAWVCALLLVGATASCSDEPASEDGVDDESDEAPDCGIAVTLLGGVDVEYSMDTSWACAIPFGGDIGLQMIFLPGDEVVGQVILDVREIHEGETGRFTASAEVISPDAATRWVTPGFDCTIDITEHEKTGEDDVSFAYEVVGEGSCAVSADAVGASESEPPPTVEPVTLSRFSFRFPGHWSK